MGYHELKLNGNIYLGNQSHPQYQLFMVSTYVTILLLNQKEI
jgi:hypothetical protein